MNFYTFRKFSPVMQLYWVLKHGTYLAQRWEDDGGVNLYHIADEGRGFFVEVGIDDGKGQPVVPRSFMSLMTLADYSHYLRATARGMG
jgi:hypothetical protein